MLRHVTQLLLAGAVCATLASPVGAEPEQEALAAASAWLTRVDSGEYAESWDTGATYFRNAISKTQWHQALTAVRTPLGKNLSREVTSKQYATSLPGAPDGEYVVIQFSSAFENKKTALETVTPMRDEDGQWRVSGYYIK